MLPEYINDIINRLEMQGYSAYAVGGCVRDTLLGLKPKDYDIATNALPSEVLKVFSDFEAVLTGLKHGTVTLIYGKNPVEVTTFRKESGYTDSRRPDNVEYINDVYIDLKRRDFTINAMAYSNGKLIDPYGGKSDLKRHVIRCVGEPDKRFSEDALRILRALRFAAVYGFEIERNTGQSLLKNKNKLNLISKERVYSELKQAVGGRFFHKTALEYSEVFQLFFHNLDSRNISKTANTNNQFVRLALLCSGDIDSLKLLKADNKTVSAVNSIICDQNVNLETDISGIRKLMYKMGEDRLCNIIDYRKACDSNSCGNAAEFIRKIKKEKYEYKISHLAVNGNDLKKYVPDKKIGLVLEKLLFDVIDGKCQNKKENLIKRTEDIDLS